MADESEPPPTIDLATTDQLIMELLSRSTFGGIVVRTEEIKDQPIEGRQTIKLMGSETLAPKQIEILLATALETWRQMLARVPPKNDPTSDRER